MAKTRVHELAKEFGVESKVILDRLKEMGEYVQSASSPVELPAEARFRQQHGARLNAAPIGTRSQQRPLVQPSAGWSRRQANGQKRRRTSWDDAGIDEQSRRVWLVKGLGDDDAQLAMYLLREGILPEDLDLPLRGRRAGARLREGMEPRHVLVREIRKLRSQVPNTARELPSTRVTRRLAF